MAWMPSDVLRSGPWARTYCCRSRTL